MFNKSMLGRDTCRLLVERLQELKPKVAVEFGSGFSTALLALYSDTLVSLENSVKYAAPWPCVRICKIEAGRYVTTLPDGVEFVLIDGPIARRYGRQETLPQVWPHLASNYEVWLDDFKRPHEKQIVRAWRNTYPIQVQRVNTAKGLAIIRPA